MTPCQPSSRIPNLWFKLENCNPSGSYKDRFAEAEIAAMRARDGGVTRVIATSSGNTGAALAACTARYGIGCTIFANGDAPAGKLMQMRAHGATVVRVPGFAADAGITAQVFAALQASGLPLVVSAYRYCPQGMAGVEAIAREIVSALEAAPEDVYVPVGGGGLYAAIARACGAGVRVHAVQPAGCATVVKAWRQGLREALAVESTTRISGLSVPMDIDATLALTHLYACGGRGIAVTDEEVYEAQRLLLQREGIYCEPAGAAAFAGYLKSGAPQTRSVCLVTGHGFKDAASIEAAAAGFASPVLAAAEVREFLREASQC